MNNNGKKSKFILKKRLDDTQTSVYNDVIQSNSKRRKVKMKKFSVIVLALVMLMSLSFAVSAADAEVVITVVGAEIAPDAETIDVVINYETEAYLLDGGFEITFPADKLELVVAEATGPKDPANDLTGLPNGQVNVKEKADGKVIVAFMSDSGAPATGSIIKMPFKVLAGAAGDEYEITIKATRLVKWV
ncbi:MAG: hypothetical protein J6R77_03960, partial [Clostridia bacterium]|nr:hypothetical protein [Clostridia bacterium]